MNIEQLLSHAKFYIYQDQKELAREILVAILREDPNNAEAWILSAQVSDKLEQVLYCLRRASSINPEELEAHPNAPQIRALIEKLQQPLAPVQSTLASPSVPITEHELESSAPLSPIVSTRSESKDTVVSTCSGLQEEEPPASTVQSVAVVERDASPVLPTSTSVSSHPATSSSGQNGRPSIPVSKRKKRWLWVVGLIVLAILVIVGILLGVKLVSEFISPLILQYFK